MIGLTNAARDGPDPHIRMMDVPAVVALTVSPAGKFRHDGNPDSGAELNNAASGT
jgi:hypothetical protein